MPVPCKKPKYAYTKNGKTRLTFCKNKVVEAKSKEVILLENKYKRKIYTGPNGGHYYKKDGKKVYV